MQFTNPFFLYLTLALAPLLAGGILLARWRRARDLRAFAAPGLARRLAAHLSPGRSALKTLAWWAGLVLLGLALAGPQWGSRMVEVRRRGLDVLIALDVSRSMLAEDVKPNRLQRAQQELTALIDRLDGDRIGILAFAGNAQVACPLTTDHSAAKMFLSDLGPESAAVPGTSLGGVIRTALGSFPKGGEGYRVLVLLTDGEDHRSDPEAAARAAKDAGVKVLTIGFGTPNGEPIPLRDGSGGVTGYLKDAQGRTVVSRLDEGLLKRLAETTGGAYWPSATGSLEADRLAEVIGRMQKRDLGAGEYGAAEDRYQVPLTLAVLLLLFSFWLPQRRGAWWLALPLALALAAPAQAGMREDVNAGNRDYGRGRYDQALQKYQDAQIKDPESPVVQYDLGNALSRTQKADDAQEAYRKAVRAADPGLRSRAWYNLGNTLLEARKYAPAVDAYVQALRAAPRDPDVLNNLALALSYLKQPPPEQDKKPDPDQDRKQDQKPGASPQSGQGQDRSGQADQEQKAGAEPQGPDDRGEAKSEKDARQDTPGEPAGAKPGEMSPQDAENLLDSVREAEREAQRRRTQGAQDRRPGRRHTAEDW